ncbi:MAG: sulfatase-like hydrolase/transferase [Geodermatophilaceae bacterium]|nr:sulfatase-like hydrolase/transferase [Geodermatophilaceae bacterium]
MGAHLNILLITLDQFRGDCLSAAGHPVVRTPHLDRLAASGVRFARHYSQAAPCAPGRASIYTGMYQMNHRVVANGTPLDARFDNIALAARRAGYDPVVFGYTDQGADPRSAVDADDPRLSVWEGILPGFEAVLDLPDDQAAWVAWLAELGYDTSGGSAQLLATESERPAEHGVSAFLTDRAIDWFDQRLAATGGEHAGPWFVHLSYLRPHPPYSAAGRWAQAYDPDDVGLPIEPALVRHPLHDAVLRHPAAAAPTDEAALRLMRAQYFGMISEVDDQLGRLRDTLTERGQWDDTFVLVTSDHGEMLGDHGLREKLGYWEQSYHVLGIVADPRLPQGHGSVVNAFTENVDVMPTICEAIGVAVPAQCDGFPLTPWLRGEKPDRWRTAAHWEFDWRGEMIGQVPHEWPWERTLERQHLAVLRTERAAYVQFGNGSWCCFDLVADPSWRTEVTDPAVVLPLAQDMLTWRSRHTGRELADMLVVDGGVGRWPQMPTGWADTA